jgi:undecaprenyl pyrophosphate synthase
MTIFEILTLSGIFLTLVIGIVNIYISYRLNKKLKAHEIGIEEVHELNSKMHDRLVDVEESIKLDKCPSNEVRIRLLYNASRLSKYDETILEDVNLLINKWSKMFAYIEYGSGNSNHITKSKSDIFDLIKTIKSNVDSVQENLYK